MQGGRTAGLGGYAQRFLCLYVFAGTERCPLPAVTGATCGDLTETKPVRPAEPRLLLLVAVRPAARCLQLCARNAPDRCPVGKAGCPPRPPTSNAPTPGAAGRVLLRRAKKQTPTFTWRRPRARAQALRPARSWTHGFRCKRAAWGARGADTGHGEGVGTGRDLARLSRPAQWLQPRPGTLPGTSLPCSCHCRLVTWRWQRPPRAARAGEAAGPAALRPASRHPLHEPQNPCNGKSGRRHSRGEGISEKEPLNWTVIGIMILEFE